MISRSITLITAFYLLNIKGILFSPYFFFLSANRNGRQTATWMHKVLSLRKVTSQRKKKKKKKKRAVILLFFFFYTSHNICTQRTV